MNKRSWFGVIATAIYLIGLTVFIYLNWTSFRSLEPNLWGDFIAGILGPLAIFWLILGYFQQGDELRNSVKALTLQAKELNQAVEQQSAMVEISEKQHELNVRTREDEFTQRLSASLPYVKLYNRGNTSGSLGRRYKFGIENLGANAFNVKVLAEDSSLLPKPLSYEKLDQRIEREFSIDIDKSKDTGWQTSIQITLENIEGKIRTQIWEIGNFPPVELSCTPPRS